MVDLTSADGSSVAQSEEEPVSSAVESSSSIPRDSTAENAEIELVASSAPSEDESVEQEVIKATESESAASEPMRVETDNTSSSMASSSSTAPPEQVESNTHPAAPADNCPVCGSTEHTAHTNLDNDTVIPTNPETGFEAEGNGGNAKIEK